MAASAAFVTILEMERDPTRQPPDDHIRMFKMLHRSLIRDPTDNIEFHTVIGTTATSATAATARVLPEEDVGSSEPVPDIQSFNFNHKYTRLTIDRVHSGPEKEDPIIFNIPPIPNLEPRARSQAAIPAASLRGLPNRPNYLLDQLPAGIEEDVEEDLELEGADLPREYDSEEDPEFDLPPEAADDDGSGQSDTTSSEDEGGKGKGKRKAGAEGRRRGEKKGARGGRGRRGGAKKGAGKAPAPAPAAPRRRIILRGDSDIDSDDLVCILILALLTQIKS